MNIESNLPDIFHYFKEGHFSFQKSSREFANIALDQFHEQNNAVLKSVGGVTNFLNRQDESALVRWELCSHDLSKMLLDFEDILSSENISICYPLQTEKHHEDTKVFRDRFVNDVEKLVEVFSENPFCVESSSPIDNINLIYDDTIIEDIRQIVEEQFKKLFLERLNLVKTPIDAVIKNNNFKLPGKEQAKRLKKRTTVDSCNS